MNAHAFLSHRPMHPSTPAPLAAANAETFLPELRDDREPGRGYGRSSGYTAQAGHTGYTPRDWAPARFSLR